MRNLKSFIFFTVTALVAGAYALNEARASRVNARQGAQKARIREGVKSGELTKGEAHRLRAQQRRINRVERRSAADGNVTDAEKARLEKMQDRASGNIHEQKHDGQGRGEAPAQ